jgi:hypothetical protein
MNDRIKLLAEQAGYTKDMFGVGHWDMPECKKFAELIVREMLVTCEEHPAWTGRMIGEQIKQHFGVEEPKGWVCPKCNADRTKIACPLGFGATVDGRCPMTVEAQ